MVFLSRKLYFSAAHRYRIEDWSDEKNRQVFGLCSNPNGHGHDYTLEVMVKGQIDERSGIVVNISDIDKVVKQLINEEFDGKFLNVEHPYFEANIPTTENIVNYLWNSLENRMIGCELHKIRLHENHYLLAEKGSDTLVHFARKYHFCAAHRLHSQHLTDEENKALFGKCNNPYGHGHNYYVEVTVSGQPDPVTGMVINLAELDEKVNRIVIDKFDHKFLNVDTEEFKEVNPTSDNMVKVIWDMLSSSLSGLYKIGLWETEKNYFEYYGPVK
ncbi:6-carboxytetrahydropterin synthase [Paenibacillus abyssi]|uniref:6-carboxy-5,6,7,8-tetrahydropterin synthase n=1 Tax=Paenibacillus abyssi TaxID=1340531 RepID=A0A917CI12_9BACL|nr:6-carboxytetrahydropterin synthase [Paenibacillus abyssi]GGF87235.1 6-pyruvoyltetrahydropterin synthase [Paenibacillus abyssi]